MMGLIGAPLLLAANVATAFGLNHKVSVWTVLATAPIFLWELSLGIYMLVKGFKPSHIISPSLPPVSRREAVPVA